MFSKFYEKIVKFIKENIKYLLFFLVFYFILTFPLPYYIYSTGGTIDTANRVTVEHQYKSKGSLSLAYVTELRGNVATWFLSFLIPSWERVKVSDYQLNEKESVDDILVRDRLSLTEANQSAIALAYQAAGKEFHITDVHFYVVYLSEDAQSDLKVGDEIIEVEHQAIERFEDVSDIVSSIPLGDRVSLTVLRGKELVSCYAEVKEISGNKRIGISATTIYDYETDPAVSLSFKENESGPSGGLMLTLAIYDKLTKDDLTKGDKIVGTGTISKDGSVGEIGGVKYKLRGAVKKKADVFLVPKGDNYDECIKLKEKEHLNIEIIGVATFDEALHYLQNRS